MYFSLLDSPFEVVYNIFLKRGVFMEKKSIIEFLKFTMFSISAGVIQMVSFTLLNELLTLKYWPSYLTALILSILWNFTLNRKFTFKAANNVRVAMAKVFGFYLIFTPVSTYLGQVAEDFGANEYIILIITMLSNFILEFLFCKFFVYNEKAE